MRQKDNKKRKCGRIKGVSPKRHPDKKAKKDSHAASKAKWRAKKKAEEEEEAKKEAEQKKYGLKDEAEFEKRFPGLDDWWRDFRCWLLTGALEKHGMAGAELLHAVKAGVLMGLQHKGGEAVKEDWK